MRLHAQKSLEENQNNYFNDICINALNKFIK
jgi:hypothetical protein